MQPPRGLAHRERFTELAQQHGLRERELELRQAALEVARQRSAELDHQPGDVVGPCRAHLWSGESS